MKKVIVIIFVVLSILNINAQNSKLSPYVRQAMMTQKSIASSARAKGAIGVAKVSEPTITAFVRTTDVDAMRQHGCKIYAQWDDIFIASIPLDKLGTLAALSQIQRIEAGKSCSVTNDTTATITRAREVWQMEQSTNQLNNQTTKQPITGNGVVVGVMDIGFDLTHPTFYSADGQTYRIKQLWDQLDQTQGGEAVIGKTDDDRDTIYVGRQYIGKEALLALQHTADGLAQTHGTHTTGTAAGSGWQGITPSTLNPQPSTLYSGMAPDADICLVCNMAGNYEGIVPESELYKYTTATDMLGFKYIFDYADKVGKPCVISFSEGSHDDLYESGIYSEVLSKMLGPGHILCASAGNEGVSKGTYVHKADGESGKGAFLINSNSNTAVYVLKSKKPVQMKLSFYRKGVKVKDRGYDLTDLAQYPDSMMGDTVLVGEDSVIVYMETYPSCFDKSLYATDLFVVDKQHGDVGSSIPVSMALQGEDNDIEAYGCGSYFVANSLDPSLTDFDHTHNILFPGSSKDAICVGATAYVTSWKNYEGNDVGYNYGVDGIRARYSSVGSALSGLTKPDVIAPGTNTISAYNSFWREKNPYDSPEHDILHTTYNDRIYPWGIMTGTSMATPAAAGIVALWLQACPTLTPDKIKDVIAHTATHYDSSMTYPNNYYGWGQIDALAGLEYIQQHYTGIEEVSSSSQGSGGKSGAKFQVPGSDAIYTLDGRRIKSLDGQHGVFIVGGRKIVR